METFLKTMERMKYVYDTILKSNNTMLFSCISAPSFIKIQAKTQKLWVQGHCKTKLGQLSLIGRTPISFFSYYVSVNSKPDHPLPPGKLPENFLKGRIPHPPGTMKVQNANPWCRKLVLKLHPGPIIFKNPTKNTKHEKEIMKNSTEMRICLEILKQ